MTMAILLVSLLQAEEEAARAAASREALGLQLQIEEGVLKVCTPMMDQN